MDDDLLILANGSLPAIPFDVRVAAAADAGFDAIGLSVWEYERLLAEGGDAAAMRRLLDERGLQMAEIEVYLGFSATAEQRRHDAIPGVPYPDASAEARFFEMATAFGARHLQAVGTFGADPLTDARAEDAADAFAGLCGRAAQFDLLVALEFVPGTDVPDAGTATAVVTAAGRPNGGLCVDSWHHFRGHADDALLRAIPTEKVMMIQLDDGAAEPVDPDFVTDTLMHRLPPGEGAFDLTGFLRLLREQGARAPISVEVLNATHATRDPAEVARTLAEATRAVLAAAYGA